MQTAQQFVITNDAYAQEPVVMTRDEFEAYLEEMGWENKGIREHSGGLYNGDERVGDEIEYEN